MVGSIGAKIEVEEGSGTPLERTGGSGWDRLFAGICGGICGEESVSYVIGTVASIAGAYVSPSEGIINVSHTTSQPLQLYTSFPALDQLILKLVQDVIE